MKLYIPNRFTSEEQMRNEIDSYFQNPDSDYYSSQEFEESGLMEDGSIPVLSEEYERDLAELFKGRVICTGDGIYVSERKKALRHISI